VDCALASLCFVGASLCLVWLVGWPPARYGPSRRTNLGLGRAAAEGFGSEDRFLVPSRDDSTRFAAMAAAGVTH